jgi:serine/threonine-protein kinase
VGSRSTTVGKYRVIRQLGEGGMGAVYEAVDEQSSQTVALKVLLPEYAKNRELAERLFREARALSRLRHPGIVEVLDYGELPDGTAYLAMELVRGQTLSTWRSRSPGPASPRLVLRLGEQLAAALVTAHAEGVIHRDVKPSNVMLIDAPADPSGFAIKLLDFGIAKLAHDTRSQKAKTATDMVMGTPYYMSPEQCQGAGYVDAKSDVYSLGIILFELLSGQLPFDGEGGGHVLGMHMFKEPPHLRYIAPQVPGGLADLIHTLLAKERAHRPSMAELSAELGRMLQAGGAPATSPLARTLLAVQRDTAPSLRHDTTLGASLGQSQFFGRRRPLIGLIAAGGLTLFASAAVLIGWHRTSVSPSTLSNPPPAPTQAAASKIRWIVTSAPSGATISRIADGSVLGTTPWTFERQAATGAESIRLRLSGYEDETLSLERDLSQKLHMNLLPRSASPMPTTAGSKPIQRSRPSGVSPTSKTPPSIKPPSKRPFQFEP